MESFSMEQGIVAALIVLAVCVGMAGQAWASWLEHKRRSQAMDVIKAAIEAGREPPPQLYEHIERADLLGNKRPWTEIVLFGALGVGFWIAYANAAADQRTAFLVIAGTMTATSVGCLALALFRPGQDRRDDDRR